MTVHDPQTPSPHPSLVPERPASAGRSCDLEFQVRHLNFLEQRSGKPFGIRTSKVFEESLLS